MGEDRGRRQVTEDAVVEDHVGERHPERHPVLVQGDEAHHHEEVEVHLDGAAGQVHQQRRGGDEAEHRHAGALPPAAAPLPGRQRADREDGALAGAVPQRHPADHPEHRGADGMEPQQHHDSPVPPLPDVRLQRAAVR
jgi:hypothetical protein